MDMATYNSDTALISAIMFFYYIVILVYIFINIGVHWKLFEKADQDGWKYIIPIYNTWIMMKIGLKETKPIKILILFIPIINIVYSIYISFKFAKAYKTSDAMAVLYVLFPTITGAIMAYSKNYKYEN